MQSTRLTRVGRLLLVLLMVFAFSAVTAAVAQAEGAPRWKVEGKVLGKNETREITAKATTSLTLEAGGVKSDVQQSERKSRRVPCRISIGRTGNERIDRRILR